MMERPNAFLQQLYTEHYERMFQLAYRMIGITELAQDLVHNVFLLALFKQDELRAHPSPEGWLMVTLKYLIQNERRRIERHPTVPLESVKNLPAKPPDFSLDIFLPTTLSKEDQTILIWRFEQQLEYHEIADRLGISESGCRSRVSRAISRCRKLLGEQ